MLYVYIITFPVLSIRENPGFGAGEFFDIVGILLNNPGVSHAAGRRMQPGTTPVPRNSTQVKDGLITSSGLRFFALQAQDDK
jgi:hypothetical protein